MGSGLCAYGLMTTAGPVPLEGVLVETEIKDLAVRQVITQRYRNSETNPIEAVYNPPLDEGAAVCGFEAMVGDVLVKGEIHEREHAFKVYDQAIAAGHGAYLLDQEKPDIFTASVGNLPPGADVLVRITTVAELSLEGGDVRYNLPTTVSPRYTPEVMRRRCGRPLPRARRWRGEYRMASKWRSSSRWAVSFAVLDRPLIRSRSTP